MIPATSATLQRTMHARVLAGALALAIAAGFVAGPARAAGAPRGPLTLSAALAMADRANPDLLEARGRVRSAAGDRRSARVLADPVFTYTPGNPPQVGVAEAVDLGPQRIFRTSQAGHALHAARFDVTDTERMVRFQVRQAFYDALLADTLAALARAESDILGQVAASDSVRLASGDVPERAVTRSAIEAATARANAERADAAARASRFALQQLLGVPAPDPALTLEGSLRYEDLPVRVDTLAQLARRARPDLAAAKQRVEAARAAWRLAISDLLPVPQVSWVHQNDQAFTNGSHDAIGVGVSIPVFTLLGGEREKARADLDQARVEDGRVRAAAESGLAAAVDAFVTAHGLAMRYAGGLLERSDAALEASRFAYERGAISQLDLFDAIRADHQVRSDACTAAHDYWVSAYALDRETGEEIVP